MPRVIVSGNLNLWGNAGQFETDRSTWGFGDGSATITRSAAQQTAGLYSAHVVKPTASGNSLLIPCNYVSVPGKKYLVKAKVRTPLANPIATDAANITFNASLDNLLLCSNVIDRVDKTVLQAKDVWVDVEIALEAIPSFFTNETVSLRIDAGVDIINMGEVFVDQMEVYEFVEVPDEPEGCDIAIDVDNVVVTDESAPGANDGSIEGAATGGDLPYEWSINGVDWQLSNLFAGLGDGNYTLRVREQGNHDCTDNHVFAVNAGAVGFDFDIDTTNETIAGASDGSAVLTPSGPGAPFTYSKDGGANFQAGNSFLGLAPGEYAFVVKDTNGITLVKYATIEPGEVDIEKVWHSKNPITQEKLASVGWEELVNYRLYNDIRVEDVADSGVFTSKLKVDLPPDADGKVIFYLNEAFRDAFKFQTPDIGATDIIRLTDRIKRYKTFTGELENQEVVPGALESSVPSLVLWGGLSKEKFPGLNYFTTYLAANKKFLTWAPVQKYVDRTQEDYLNFFVYDFFSSLKLRIKAYFDDNTNTTSTVQTINGVQRYQLYQIPAGPTNSGAILVNPAKTLVKYEISLLDETDAVISEVRTYHVVPDRHPNTRHLMFLNSLGAYEVLRFIGQAQHKTDFQREILQKFLPHNYETLDGEFVANEVVSQKTNSYSTGFIKGALAKQWHAYIEDLMLSPKVFLIGDSGNRLPIVVIGGELLTEDQNYERFVRFEVKPAYDNVSFTPEDV